MVTWTVDVDGGDYGGRSKTQEGIRVGLPLVLKAFRDFKLKGAIFFISTELLPTHDGLIERITNEGHQIASHGHFHTVYREKWRSEADRQLSLEILAKHQSVPKESIRYRAPKFNFRVSGEQFSDRKGHTGLLRHMWLSEPVRNIIYLHPFDIVGGNNAPNLFCKLWYSNPTRAFDTLKTLLEKYHG